MGGECGCKGVFGVDFDFLNGCVGEKSLKRRRDHKKLTAHQKAPRS